MRLYLGTLIYDNEKCSRHIVKAERKAPPPVESGVGGGCTMLLFNGTGSSEILVQSKHRWDVFKIGVDEVWKLKK